MIQINEKSIFSGLLFLFTGLLLYITIGMRSDVALVPRIVGFTMLIFSGIDLVHSLFPAVRERLPFLNKRASETAFVQMGAAEEPEKAEEPVASKETGQSLLLFAGWILLFVILIYFTNMILAILASLFIYLKWVIKESWKLTILYSVTAAILSYLVFVKAFGIHHMWS
ncbi:MULTISPECIES: tripartite tricarboxylate transporter TctB family protein [unclassified Paenibacillus]|uniref:tripartite tricarboxylate transporter TctB family protein n=1 Tax=unclassified Paenibacillus TaxID=185978 RepID=UPI001AE90797|nr:MULTISPECIES: tripartite tricarboxylate transporter TctB family protein [unclassified Paenibacillus]MBP1154055.1 hypothetical protein [Paenibacillus sp. PvP091]MBP1170560.1 hypothetical protein [Paenibacillus sp. PvR098]MBP2441588.1 hypothetical protein [Paenibacillus sp. PvP052]